MASITDNLTYVDLTKLSSYNETLNITTNLTFETFRDNIFSVFATYTILQWILSFIIFISIFMILKQILSTEFFSDIQLLMLSSFIITSMNILLLIFEIFTITAPLQLFFIIWIGSLIALIIKK